MPFTDQEKVQLRRHLGLSTVAESNYPWVDTFWAVDKVLTTLSTAAEAEARSILAKLTTIETALDTAISRLKASKVGSITLNATETRDLRTERARWRRELSVLLGVPLAHPGGMIQVV